MKLLQVKLLVLMKLLTAVNPANLIIPVNQAKVIKIVNLNGQIRNWNRQNVEIHLLQGSGTNGHLEHPFAAMDIRDRHPGGVGRFRQIFRSDFLRKFSGNFAVFSIYLSSCRDGRENRGGNSDRGYPPVAEVSPPTP